MSRADGRRRAIATMRRLYPGARIESNGIERKPGVAMYAVRRRLRGKSFVWVVVGSGVGDTWRQAEVEAQHRHRAAVQCR